MTITSTWSSVSVDLFPDLTDPSLVGAWMCDPASGKMIDLTVSGNDGTISGSTIEPTILGPMRRYLPNNGVAGTPLGPADAFPLNDVTVSFWMRIDPGATGNAYSINYYSGIADAWGIYHFGGGDIRIYDDIDNVGVWRYTTTIPQSKLIHCVAVMDSLENFLYADNVLLGSGEFSSDDWSSFAGTLCHGSRFLASPNIAEGIVSPLCIYNEAKDQNWVTEQYNKGARAIPFKTDSGAEVSIVTETSGNLSNTPFEIINGSWKMTQESFDRNFFNNTIITDGDMEAGDTSAWTAGNSAYLTKSTVEHTGVYSLSIREDGAVNPYAYQSALTVGQGYKVKGWARVQNENEMQPRLYCGTTLLWTGATSPDDTWEPFEVIFQADNTELRLYAWGNFFTSRVYWDDITVSTMDARHTAIECVAAGNCILPNSYAEATPTEMAFGTWDFWAYKGADANTSRIMLIASDNDVVTGATQNGYWVSLRSDEEVRLQHIANGAPALNLIQSGVGYIANNTWYRFRLTRDYEGVFVLYIRGGAYTDWTTVGTSAANLTETISNYTVLDLDAGDRFAYNDQAGGHGFTKYLGIPSM